MERNEYKLGQNKMKHGGPMGGPPGGPAGMGGEKTKDLVGTWKKLLDYCRRYTVVFMSLNFKLCK